MPDELRIETWEGLKPYFEELKTRQFESVNDLESWVKDLSEVEAIISEEIAWRYIRTTVDTTDQKAEESYSYFVKEINPHLKEYWNDFNEKLLASEFRAELDQEKYFVYLRSVNRQAELFTTENIPIQTELKMKEQEYAPISGAMTIEVDGKEMTLQQAAEFLKYPDRKLREHVYWQIYERRKKRRGKTGPADGRATRAKGFTCHECRLR